MTTEEFFKQIIIPYWPQITLFTGIIIGGLGYILRSIFAYSIKRRELSFSFDLKKNEIQFNKKLEHQVESIIQYHKKYDALVEILTLTVSEYKYNNAIGNNTVNNITNASNDLWNAYSMLKLFLAKNLYQYYENVDEKITRFVFCLLTELNHNGDYGILQNLESAFVAVAKECKNEFDNASVEFRKFYFNDVD